MKSLSRDKKLVIGCYLFFLVTSILVCLYNFGEDRLLRRLGKLETFTLSASDFELVDMQPAEGGAYLSTSTDPRMLLKGLSGKRVRSVEMQVVYTSEPGEVTLFYMPRAGMEEFSAQYRVWAVKDDDTHYTFTLPRGKVFGIRIDPAMYTSAGMQFLSIVCNPVRPVSSFFRVSGSWLFYFFVCPALLASALKYSIALWNYLTAARGKTRAGRAEH